jgi:tRNA threonylcarbamoyladenosine biosynthesis protein TsaB
LRIGVATAKGYCYALSKPLIAVPTLQLLFEGIKKKLSGAQYYLPLIDARRMDVYAALYDAAGNEIIAPGFFTINEQFAQKISRYRNLAVGGDGAEKSRQFLTGSNIHFVNNVVPDARLMATIAEAKFNKGEVADTAYFEPMYINEFQAKLPKAK